MKPSHSRSSTSQEHNDASSSDMIDNSPATASSSSLSSQSPVTPRRQIPKRHIHRRRASQPAPSSTLSRSVGSSTTAYTSQGEDSDRYDSTSTSSSEEDDWEGSKRESLDYLDLSLSLPYTLVSLRTHILLQCSQLEQRVRTLYSFPLGSNSDTPGRVDSHFAATFYSHLDSLKEDLRKLVLYLPTSAPSIAFPFPISTERATAAFSAGSQSLAQDWERLSTAVHTSLSLNSDLHLALPNAKSHLPTFSSFRPLAAIDFTSALQSLALHLPLSGVNLLEKVQVSFEALQDSVSTMTLRDCFYWSRSKSAESSNQVKPVSHRRGSSSQLVLARQFESILDTIKVKGEQVRTSGHAKAAYVAKAAWETEERLYTAAVELARGGQGLIRYEHLPTLWKNNEHILSGYRFIPANDIGALLKSTFQIHNETGNIMTHLIGALIVAPLFWPSKHQFDEQTTPMDRMVQTIYLIAALKCLILSVSWHVMAGCSDACWFERFACVDYTGIAWLVAASVWTLVYNAFYCQPNLAMFYSLTTLLVGAIGAIVPWAAWFNDRKNKPIRVAIFLTMCFTGVGPFLHASLSHGFIKTSLFFSPILPSVAAYIFGLIFYVTQFPESFAPGRFDVVGHAHQIWHISIVVAILLHYRATFIWHQGRFDFSCAVNPLQQSASTLSKITNMRSDAFDLTSSLFGDRHVFQKAAADLSLADDIVHGWRISVGKWGDGMVGRAWDWCVDHLMAAF